jgi:hypothetical protein
VAGLARIDRSVPDPAGPAASGRGASAPGSPRSLRLLGTAAYDVWLITWPAGTGMGHHEHGSSSSVMQVVSGSLVESVSPPDGGPDRLRPLGSGCSSTLGAGQSHELWNPAAYEATSVHAYSPPLDTVTYSDRAAATRSPTRPATLDPSASPSGRGPGRVRSFAGVAAEATSADGVR